MRNTALVNTIVWIFLLIGPAIMGGSVYFGWRTAKKVQAVESWPTARAYIIESRIQWAVQAHDRIGTQRSYSYGYRLPVLAGYQVDGQYYTSATPAITTINDTKIMPRDPWRNPPDDDIVTLFKQVPQGAVVPIHYNPANHKEAYLFTNLPFLELYTFNIVAFLFGLFFSLIFLIPVLLVKKYRKK